MSNTVAAIQMCSSPILEDNLNLAANLIKRAAEQSAKLIILPEMFAIAGNTLSDKLNVKEEFGAGKIQDFLRDQAINNNVWIIGGTIPIKSDNPNKIFAACLVYNSSGEVVARYDKMHLFDVELTETEYYKESDSTEAGKQPVVIQTPFGNVGIAVCYDVRFPLLINELVLNGAEILVIPAAFTHTTGKDHWAVLLKNRAIENSCYVVAAAQCSVHVSGRKFYGHSVIIDPWGSVLHELADEHGVAISDIDLEFLKSVRKKLPAVELRLREQNKQV